MQNDHSSRREVLVGVEVKIKKYMGRLVDESSDDAYIGTDEEPHTNSCSRKQTLKILNNSHTRTCHRR